MRIRRAYPLGHFIVFKSVRDVAGPTAGARPVLRQAYDKPLTVFDALLHFGEGACMFGDGLVLPS